MKIYRFSIEWLVGIIILLFATSVSYAQENDPDRLFLKFTDTFDGHIKNSTAVRLGELDKFVKIYNSIELEYSKWFNDFLSFTVAGRAVYDGVYDVEDDFNPENEDDYRAYVALREAVLDLSFGKFDVHLGKQQVVWGKTDGFRVTDVVNPLDLKDVASTEFLDQRIPLWMANFEYYFTPDSSLQLLVIPEMQFNEFSFPQFSDGTIVTGTEKPDVTIENIEYGAKLSGFLKGWDFTVNYLYSWDDTPVFRSSRDKDTEVLTVSPEYERLHIVGGTFATVVWDAVIRGELAAKFDKYFSVDNSDVSGMVTEKNLLNYAVAVERDLFDIHWVAQGLQETILDYDNAITTDEVSTYLTLDMSKDFLRETLEISTFIIYSANDGQFTFQPALEYDYTDSIKLTFGVDFLINENNDADENEERVYAEITYSF